MKRAIVVSLFLWLPFAVWADGMFIPTFAYPAKVTIPDQQALIGFSNGVERLVIETRFAGAGTNFAWVVPLPGQPVIEAATTGLFPTLGYLCRPDIIHEVSEYYLGILFLAAVIYCYSRARQAPYGVFSALLIFLILLLFAGLFLPVLRGGKSRAMAVSTSATGAVSILDRKIVGVFETTTIASKDARGLENWLHDNGYAMPAEAGPVIADYVKEGWMFVAAKVGRDHADTETSTPNPLSFTFQTGRPVYPMRLTGLNSRSLAVDLYVIGDVSATVPDFKVASSLRRDLSHSALRQWFGPSAVITKLTATLSPAAMRGDIWVNMSSGYAEKKDRLYSRHGAMTTAANWGAGYFAAALLFLSCVAAAGPGNRTKSSSVIGATGLISCLLTGLIYLSLPTIDVRLARGRVFDQARQEVFALAMSLEDYNISSLGEARAVAQKIVSDPTNAPCCGLKNWDNQYLGGQFHEEDSPGNYLLRETNRQLQVIMITPDAGESVQASIDLPMRH